MANILLILLRRWCIIYRYLFLRLFSILRSLGSQSGFDFALCLAILLLIHLSGDFANEIHSWARKLLLLEMFSDILYYAGRIK